MDTNRIIKIEELEIGDEILVSSNGHLRYYKVLRRPKLSKKNRWSGVPCSMNAIEEERILFPGTIYERHRTITTYFCTPENHNMKKSIYGLSWKDMWLVRREGI